MLPRKTFIYFLLDTPSGNAYHRDSTGTISTQVITAGATDVTLKNAPANWLDTELGYERSSIYHGVQRSFSTPMDFVRDALQMVKELFLLGAGTEVPLTLAVFKYNSQPKAGEPDYKLYFKSNIDLSGISENVLETLSANLMEGGVAQLLKSYEGTTLQIPCDGSIAENQKINFDGALVNDTFFYQIAPINDIYEVGYNGGYFSTLAASFINNQGDNYGIVHGDPSTNFIFSDAFDYVVIGNDAKIGTNYIFYSTRKIDLQIKGNLNCRFNKRGVLFQLVIATSTGRVEPISAKIAGYNTKEISIGFDHKITIAPDEKLFIYFQILYQPFGGETGHNVMDFLGGSFSIAFASIAGPTRAWGISFPDLFKLILRQICLLSTTQTQTFNYEAISNLLNQYSNLFALSGDSLRASGDPAYQRFYSLTQTNQILQQSYGPVIKISLKDFFESVEAILCAELQSGHNGTTETLEIETLDSIYNSDVVNFDIGEVASLKWGFAKDLAFSDFEIGYAPQTYDQKAGKYEWNTTLSMKAPVNTFQKKLSKISKIRFDSYGIEKLRSNTGQATSTTRNDSDNSVFGANVDLLNWMWDYFNANFTSQNSNPDDPLNTNINYYQTYNIHQQNIPFQPVNIPITDGDYFQPNTDQSIIIFSYPLTSNQNGHLVVSGIINSVGKPPLEPDDTFILKVWHNGIIIHTEIITVAGVNTPINIDYSFTRTFNYKDAFYITMATTATCQADNINANMTFANVTSPTIFWGNLTAANVPVDVGTAQKLLSFSQILPLNNPYAVGTSLLQYGFQYFTFVSRVSNTNFKLITGFQGYLSNDDADFEINVYINGILQPESMIIHQSGSRSQFSNSIPSITRDYNFNDIVFFTASVYGANLNASLFSCNARWESTSIKAYSLKRVQYDSLSGIPNLAKNQAGQIRSDIAGAPYNIEDVTPKKMYRRWRNYIMSTFMDQVTGDMIFQTLSKNAYLSRSYNGDVIIEKSNESVLGFKRLFYPIPVELKTNIPPGFAELMSVSKNAHVHCTFMGNDIYFFADSLKQKPALNESQTWKGILSPKTDLKIFAKITGFKIPDMSDNSISCAFASSVQFVPYNQTSNPQYHTRNRNEFLFKDQVGNWLAKDDYGQPVQIGDPLPLQFIARGLSNITYTVYRCADDSVYSSGSINVMASPAISDPYTLWQRIIDTSAWGRDNYYLIIYAAGSPVYQSEALLVREPYELEDTVLIEAVNSFNSQGIVFDTWFKLSMRIRGGYDNKFKQKYLGKFYVDQPQDITILNAVPYETTTLLIGREGGVPDYVPKKVLRMLIMDGCTLDGEGFSLNEGAELEEMFTKGAPMKFHSVEIRPSKNMNGSTATHSGVTDNDSSLIVSVNPQSFGPNVTNSSGTTDTDLIQITVND